MVKKLKILYFILIMLVSLPAQADIAPPPMTSFQAYINKQGHFIMKPADWKYKQFRENYKLLSSENKNDYRGEYHDGLALVYKDGKFSFTDENGREAGSNFVPICRTRSLSGGYHNDHKCSAQTMFSEGLAPVKYDEKPYVYLNHKKLEAVIPDGFVWNQNSWHDVYGEEKDGKFYAVTSDYNQKQGLTKAYINYEYKYGYMDTKGNIAIETKFNELYPFSEGLAAVCRNHNHCGYIDKTGKMVIKPDFLHAGAFNNGAAQVQARTRTIIAPFSIALLILVLIAGISFKRDMKKAAEKQADAGS